MNPIYRYRCTIERESETRDVLVLFAATKLIQPESLASTIEDEIEANLAPDEVFIVVRDPGFNEALTLLRDGAYSTKTFERLGKHATVTLVGYDRYRSESRREHIFGENAPFEIQFCDFCRQAITDIFKVRHGFVESTSTYHFENPSGRHTERFIRLSNILVRGAEIAFIGFCTLPFIPENVAIAYIDTPSLYAVIAAINEQLASFPGITHPILADNFASYGGLKHYQFDRQSDALVLISASSSGSLGGRLVREHGFESKRVVHLLFLGKRDSEVPIVCDLKYDPEENRDGIEDLPLVEHAAECGMCATGSVAIKLQGDQFDMAGPQPSSLLINKVDGPSGLADLMRRTAAAKIYAVGLGRVPGKQRSLYHINEMALLDSSKFSERLDYVMRRSIPASLSYIIHVDDRSKPLAERIAAFVEQSSHATSLVAATSLSTIQTNTKSAIVVVASVIESGRSLLDVSRDLRSVAPKAPLIYLVGMSKTTGEERRESLSKTLTKTNLPLAHQFVEVEKIGLPASSTDNPWAMELNLLQSDEIAAIVEAEIKIYIDERITRLRKLSEPLINDLFLENAPGQRLQLQPGFVFWHSDTCNSSHSQSDVFFTISSVLQQLRANAETGKVPAIKTSWFQQTILASGNFGRFNDDVIQASILRAAFPYELNYTNSPSDSREIARIIRRIIESSNAPRGGAAAEFLLAIATRRLQLCPSDVKDVLEARGTNSPILDFLQKACQVKGIGAPA